MEIIEAIKPIWRDRQIGVRISPNGIYNDMGSPDYCEQFFYVTRELAAYDLAYLHIIDGLSFGFHELGEPMTLNEFRQVYSGNIMGNCGYTQELAEERFQFNHANLIAFGRLFIANPDLIYRFRNNVELNPDADMSAWYSDTGAAGYTDFPLVSRNTL